MLSVFKRKKKKKSKSEDDPEGSETADVGPEETNVGGNRSNDCGGNYWKESALTSCLFLFVTG
jgi:hypothetical protein